MTPRRVAVPTRRVQAWSLLAAAAALCVVTGGTWMGATPQQPAPSGATVRYVPETLQDTAWLERLGKAQAKAAAGAKVFHDFRFTDRLADSGIAFRHRIVDDAGKTYKAAHYDHGNGLAIADVDGDGLLDVYFANQVGGNHLEKYLGGG